MYARTLSAQERDFLDQIIAGNSDFNTFRRAMIIRFSALGRSIPVISKWIGYDEETVGRIIEQFNREGIQFIGHPKPNHGYGQSTNT